MSARGRSLHQERGRLPRGSVTFISVYPKSCSAGVSNVDLDAAYESSGAARGVRCGQLRYRFNRLNCIGTGEGVK